MPDLTISQINSLASQNPQLYEALVRIIQAINDLKSQMATLQSAGGANG